MSAVAEPARLSRRRRRRLPAPPRPAVVTALGAAAGLGLGATLALGIGAESAGSLSAPGGALTAAGRLTGLVAAYAMVVVVLLIARIPQLERAVGQDRLVAWHRRLGPWPLYLLGAHGVLITLGYAQAARTGALQELWTLITTYQGVLAATAGGALLIAAGVLSYRKARAKMAHETWWSVHLYTYLALLLSFSHQIGTGASFVGHPTATLFWTVLWVGTLVTVVAFRIALPLWRTLRHDLRVVRVEREAPGVVSIVLRGRRLDRIPVAGGQFFQWRFLRPGMWWQAHPFSLSAAPTGSELRITVKDLGDLSGALARVEPGTRVGIEGPYGAFTPDARQGDRVLLVGAGVGAAPILALLQELPRRADATVVLRASTRDDLVLRDEIADEVHARDGRLFELVGPRARTPLDERALRTVAPDIAERDVFVCGPDGFTESLAGELRAAGVPADRIHFETFTF